MHDGTFQYTRPTVEQMQQMEDLRQHFTDFAKMLERNLPEGPDKTFIMRQLRTISMWANVAITRQPDGAPR